MLPEPVPSPLPSEFDPSRMNLAALTDAEALLSHLDCQLTGRCGEVLAGAADTIDSLDDTLTGHFERALPEQEMLLGKLDDKLDALLATRLGEAYSYLMGLGIPIPTDEEVIYHAMTGELAPDLAVSPDEFVDNRIQGPRKDPPDDPGERNKPPIDFPPVPPRPRPPVDPVPPRYGPLPPPPPPPPPPRPMPPGPPFLPPQAPCPPGQPIPVPVPYPVPYGPVPPNYPPWPPYRPPYGGPVPMPPVPPLPWPPWMPPPTGGPLPPPAPPMPPAPPVPPAPPPSPPVPPPSPPQPPVPSPPYYPPTPIPPVPPPYLPPAPPVPPPVPPEPPEPPEPPDEPEPPKPSCTPPAREEAPGTPCEFLATVPEEIPDELKPVRNLVHDLMQKLVWPILAGWCGPMKVQLDPQSWVTAAICGDVKVGDGPKEDDGLVDTPLPPTSDFPVCGPREVKRPSFFLPWVLLAECVGDKWIVHEEIKKDTDDPFPIGAGFCLLGWYPDQITAADAKFNYRNKPAEVVKRFGECKQGLPPSAQPKNLKPLPDWSAIDWNSDDVCDKILEISDNLTVAGPVEFSQIIGLRWADGTTRIPPWLAKIASFLPESWQKALTSGLSDVAEAAWNWLDSLPPINDCKTRSAAIPIIIKGMLSAIQRWTGFDTSDISVPYDYWYQWNCPFELPSSVDIHAMWARGIISGSLAECLLRANGLLPHWQDKIHEAGRPWPRMAELYNAQATKKLDPNRFLELKKRAGYQNDSDYANWLMTSYQPVNTSDLVTFMTRDAADEKNIDWSAADAEFKDKWTDPLKAWGDGARVNEDVMKYAWRSHYRLPSPTQLYEMRHRLRKDMVPDKLVVDQKLLLSTLGQNDIHPAWRERLEAISYRPLTRVDAKRAYFQGDLGYDELRNAFMDIGYTAANARTLADFTRTEKVRKAANHRIIKLYRKGGLPRADAERLLADEKVFPEIVKAELDFIDLEKRAAGRRACLAALKRSFKKGDLRQADIPAAVSLLGFSVEEGQDYQTLWTCERENTGKTISAAQLCEWYQYGLLSPNQMQGRLVDLGYASTDAWDIVRMCHRKALGEDLDLTPPRIDMPLPPEQRKQGGGRDAKK